MNIWQNLKSVEFQSFIFNASGPRCTTQDELLRIAWSSCGWTTMKSCSPDAREGNPEPRYVEVEFGSINSMGLPNHGYKKYIEYAGEIKKQYPDKPIIASIVGFSPNDFVTLTKAFQEAENVDVLEINLSCPNVVWKPQIAYDFETTDILLEQIFSLDVTKPIGFKLPPYFDPVHTEMMANILKKYPVDFITCINSVGNTLMIDPETESPLIAPKGWLGWLGWDYVKPVALANVRMFYKLIWGKTKIIWCWGIKNGVDVFEHLLAWASLVQLGTIFWKEDTACFKRIEKEFVEYVSMKWYSDISQIIWNLKEL